MRRRKKPSLLAQLRNPRKNRQLRRSRAVASLIQWALVVRGEPQLPVNSDLAGIQVRKLVRAIRNFVVPLSVSWVT